MAGRRWRGFGGASRIGAGHPSWSGAEPRISTLRGGEGATVKRGAEGFRPPQTPRRCSLPITALRVSPPPKRAAIWLALKPSRQARCRASTRGSGHIAVGGGRFELSGAGAIWLMNAIIRFSVLMASRNTENRRSVIPFFTSH
jgi:hypothetical protein